MRTEDFTDITYAVHDGGVAVVTIDRPDVLNALNTALLEELLATLTDLGGDAEIAAIIMTGEGDRSFIAGADIKEMAGKTPLEARAYSELGQEIAHTLETMRKPTIAAVNGYALGGGCEMALACDVRLASENAHFGQPEINLGIIPGGGGTQRLARVLGKQRAMELVLTGERFDAAAALELGLVNRVVEGDGWLDEAMALAASVATRPPIAARLAKQAVIAAEETALSAGLESERRLYELAMATEDRVEGMNAFVEKREPEFEGK